MKRTIRLTEGRLRRMITESVRQVINELDWKTYKNAANKRWDQGWWKTGDSKLRMYRKARDLDNASDQAFNRDYGFKQTDSDNWYYDEADETVSKNNGVLGIHKYQRHAKPGLNTHTMYHPYIDKTDYTYSYYGENPSDDVERDYSRKGLDPGFFSKQGLDALNKAREENDNYNNNNYQYFKGKGWQLKNK